MQSRCQKSLHTLVQLSGKCTHFLNKDSILLPRGQSSRHIKCLCGNTQQRIDTDSIRFQLWDDADVQNRFNGKVKFKTGLVRSLDMYLGTNLIRLHNSIWTWSMSPSKCVWEAVRIYKAYVTKYLSKGQRLPMRAESPLSIGYCAELDLPGDHIRHPINSPRQE